MTAIAVSFVLYGKLSTDAVKNYEKTTTVKLLRKQSMRENPSKDECKEKIHLQAKIKTRTKTQPPG